MAKCIMIQGTGSTVGKSIVTAGICRVLKQDGYRVAPFKAQNMALNSYVTKDGKEMSRSQVVQSEAAMIEPMIEMNPILLKPTSEMGSQVILNGKVYGNVSAYKYHSMKSIFKQSIKEAYDKLSSQFDVIVIEGAGSPAEINLKKDDLANMGIAELVNAPVVLVGDIDKGGVFASIYGTVMLLEDSERERIKGYIINKFRGNLDILKPGIEMFRQKMDTPCLGVVPFKKLNIDEEDSVTTRFDAVKKGNINIGVIRLPYMSNFTDFTVFDMELDVSVQYITSPENCTDIDLVVIPGSKNTIKDMVYLHESGMSKAIYKKHKEGIPIIGICGGYQILGQELEDPKGIESSLSQINGLGLLDIRTIIHEQKMTTQTSGTLKCQLPFTPDLSQDTVTGYEIHMGVSEITKDTTQPAIILEDGRLGGAVSKGGMVFGTYLHGIFDNDDFRNAMLNHIRKVKGMEQLDKFTYEAYKEEQYNQLADLLRSHLDFNHIKHIIGL